MMVFKLLTRFVKYLFSSLKKDAALQHREEGIVKKEEKTALNETILEEKERKNANKIQNENLQILSLNDKLIPNLGYFIASINLYLKTKDVKYTAGAQGRFHYISDEFRKSLEIWKRVYNNFKTSEEQFEKIVGKESKARNELQEENRILHKEYRNLTRSNRRGEDLDQVKKEAFIKRKMDLLRRHLALLDESSENSKQLLILTKKRLNETKSLVKRAGEIEQKVNEHQKSWKLFFKLLNEMLSFFRKEEKFSQYIVTSEKEEKTHLNINLAIENSIFKIIKEKEILDKEYKQLLIQEEVHQQKGDEEIPLAA